MFNLVDGLTGNGVLRKAGCHMVPARWMVYCKEYISIKNTKQNLLVFIPRTFTLESRNKNYSAPIGSIFGFKKSQVVCGFPRCKMKK